MCKGGGGGESGKPSQRAMNSQSDTTAARMESKPAVAAPVGHRGYAPMRVRDLVLGGLELLGVLAACAILGAASAGVF